MRGLINTIQRFNVHDGPGVRTVVFLQGCPLRCMWCSNPDTWNTNPCFIRDAAACINCGACSPGIFTEDMADRCPAGAIRGIGGYREASEVVERVLRDARFYSESGGGMTLSGGEPLAQPAFVMELLKPVKDEGIHTAIETSGYAPAETMEELKRYCDLALFDIKVFDRERHVRYTGIDNTGILENLKYLSASIETVVRMPVIAGINDDEENARRTADFLRNCRITAVDLLPYHKYGVSKYKILKIPYSLEGGTPSREKLGELRDIYRAAGIPVRVMQH
jgi:pyruvate formate lyase activating enzyme